MKNLRNTLIFSAVLSGLLGIWNLIDRQYITAIAWFCAFSADMVALDLIKALKRTAEILADDVIRGIEIEVQKKIEEQEKHE